MAGLGLGFIEASTPRCISPISPLWTWPIDLTPLPFHANFGIHLEASPSGAHELSSFAEGLCRTRPLRPVHTLVPETGHFWRERVHRMAGTVAKRFQKPRGFQKSLRFLTTFGVETTFGVVGFLGRVSDSCITQLKAQGPSRT